MAYDHRKATLPATFPRRQLLKGSALLAAGASPLGIPLRSLAAQTSAGATPVASPVPVVDYLPSALSNDEFATLKAVVARIIPSDELGPGAVEAGVQIYIDRALGTTQASSLDAYRSGLKALDAAAGADGFAAASPEQQDSVLKTAEAGKLSGDPGGFFAMVLEHTRQGMFSDPVHGGNANFVGWDLMGYPGIKLIWSEQDQQINATPSPEHISVAKFQEATS